MRVAFLTPEIGSSYGWARYGMEIGRELTAQGVDLHLAHVVNATDVLDPEDGDSFYDPTSGSGSLLINIGSSVAKHMDSADNIKYYAKELKECCAKYF